VRRSKTSPAASRDMSAMALGALAKATSTSQCAASALVALTLTTPTRCDDLQQQSC